MTPNSSDFQEFLNHLSENALHSLQQADGIARATSSPYVGTEHLLLGVLSQQNSMGAKILADAGVSLNKTQQALNLKPSSNVLNMGAKGLSETAKLTLRMAYDVSQDFGQDYCGTEHIVYSILTQKNARATVILRDMNANVDEMVSAMESFL